MRGGAEEARLDPETVDAVLAAAGHRVRQRPRELPAGLTEQNNPDDAAAWIAGWTDARTEAPAAICSHVCCAAAAAARSCTRGRATTA